MKITLMYNYDMEAPTIYRIKRRIYIKNNNDRYILLPVKSKKELNELYMILKKYKLDNKYYEIVMTKNKELTIIYAGTEFVLIKITNTNNISLTEERISTNLTLPASIYNLDRSNWYFLWSKKNDYIEYKSNHVRKKYKLIDESVDYYLGMAETAIAYLNNINNYELKQNLTLSHRRIIDDEMKNPLNIIIDVKERDISEYLKYLFINQRYSQERIKGILFGYPDTEISYIRIYARLLYPNYYFDLYENIELEKENEEKLKELIKRIDEYEIYLKDIFNIIISRQKIKKIDWI